MKKRMLATAALALVMLVGSAMNAAAAGNDSIVFDGNAKEFVHTIGGDAENGFENMLPGESRTLTMELANDSSEELKFFMSSDILKSDIAEQGDRNAVYDFSIANNGEVFFQAVIGGDNEDNISVGKEFLQEDNNILLATLAKGEGCEIAITIALDGDSMENSYMSSAGNLVFQFSAETKDPAPTVVETTYKYVKGATQNIVKSVRTGDALPIGVVVAAGISLLVIIILMAKKRREKVEE